MNWSYETMIDPINFGYVRRCLRQAKSPVCGALFVARQELLAEVASLVDEGAPGALELRQRRLIALFEAGQVLKGTGPGQGGVDMEAIPEHASCHVIQMPPLYLVHLPGLLDLEERRPARVRVQH